MIQSKKHEIQLKMKLKNPFSEDTRLLYLYRIDCSKCGSNQALELHHILGRISSSPFNACLLCHECHEHITRSEAPYLFGLNMKFLLDSQYKPTDEDYQFIRKNAKELSITTNT